ncbi:MAG: hypoxanthine phosphoribosyltransferase [Bacteroidales bacterium]|nr:hypoxanthine phosphoribosyltransferase [Bacteroidales bacterium]
MSIIKVSDKEFAPFIPQEKIENEIHRIASEIKRDMAAKDPLFLVMLNGAFMFAAELFKSLDMACEMAFVKYKTYVGTHSTGKPNELLGIEQEKVKDRDIVIIEDIVDSGFTMGELLKDLNNKGAKNIKIATMMFKPNAFKYNYKIDYIGMNIGNDFIVGYGLDYNEYGRNLKEIYKIVE